MLVRRSAPSSMAIYPSKNTPCRNTSFKSYRCQLYCIIVKSILSQKACKHAFRHASPQSCLCVAQLLQTWRLGSQACGQFGKYLQIEKQPVPLVQVVFLTGSYLSSQAASSQVLSTYKGLTTVFGMGTGGSPQPSPPDYLIEVCTLKTSTEE